MNITTDFNNQQCREALARFKQEDIEQAIHVITSNDSDLINKAANNDEMGRVVFWTREWMAVEHIKTKRAAITRLNQIRASSGIRAQRYIGRLNAVFGLNL